MTLMVKILGKRGDKQHNDESYYATVRALMETNCELLKESIKELNRLKEEEIKGKELVKRLEKQNKELNRLLKKEDRE